MFQSGQHSIQSDAIDQLHDVVVKTVMLTDAKHGHDVGVVQSGRRLGLALETLQVFGIDQGLPRQYLDGDPAS